MNQETINLLAHKAEVKIDKLNESKLKYLDTINVCRNVCWIQDVY